MAQQTAVEFLEQQLTARLGNLWIEDFEQAKQMEKEQTFQAFKAGQDSMEDGGKSFDQWYIKER